jgi:GMP reductase
MRLVTDTKLDFSDVLILPKRSTLQSRSDVSLDREFVYKHSGYKFQGIPIMAANMDGVGTFEMAEELAKLGMFTCLVKHYPKYELKNWIDEIGVNINMRWAYSLGIAPQDLSKFDAVYSAVQSGAIQYVCIDVANGYTEKFVEFIKKFRDSYKDITIIAGNVVTGEMTEELVLSGVDIVKIGIGPGSVCTTRLKTGVGFPQLSAIIECADAAHGLGGHIISDGGCTCPGDVSKAFGAGADFVMLGGMLAGHDEGGGEKMTRVYTHEWTGMDRKPCIELKQFVQFYGMSSKAANEKHSGGLKDYRASEGREVLIPYRGKVSDTVQDILGGLRSTLTYVGASKLKELSKRTTFIQVNNQVNNVFGK